MKLPGKVVVGWRTYPIRELPLKQARADGVLGWHENYPNAIAVRTEEMSPADVADTLLHEILHACWWTGELPPKANEEKAVTVLAHGLLQVLRDNPAVVDFLVKSARTMP
jgi:hypothetical protein